PGGSNSCTEPEFNTNTTTGMGYTSIPAANVLASVFLFVALLAGLVVNSLYLWVLRFRMRRSINTIWFLHLILSYFLFTFIIPFIAVYVLMLSHWVFGDLLCKLISSLINVCMYTSVFLLTVISLDRYCLVFHPVWYRGHMNNRYATAICFCIWGSAILFSSPYLAFSETLLRKDNKTAICNDYMLPGSISQKSAIQLRWVMFSLRLILSFLLPFAVMTVCYVRIALRMKKGNLARSTKPYKIMFITVASFLVSWVPYHLWYGMKIEEGRFHESTLEILMDLAICFTCINYCFTPLLYLFITENFKKSIQKSVLLLIESVFNETFNSFNRTLTETLH
uniref:Probable G-protein coupled receptor 33 n=1 Tax=Xenopus tropicalis TaxID=8364 RepID=A0A6I8RK78_XENTR